MKITHSETRRPHNLIPVSEPLLNGNEKKYVVECIESSWVSSEGKYVEELERKCADYCSMSEGVAVSSGTAALWIAISCLPLEQGDEIIIPSFTIISCAIAVIEAGARPVLVDCDPETWTMDVAQIASKITKRTKAIMAVHMYGHPVDMDPILEVARTYNLFIIEDAAQAHGAEYKGRKCGCLSDISILSFYANKLVTTGEGGMVLTNDKGFAEKARSLRNLCFRPERRFYHTEIGYNFRLSNIQAAIGVAQIERLEEFVERKRSMARRYHEGLNALPLQLPIEKPWAKNVYWMYAVVINDDAGMVADECASLLLSTGIQTRPFFIGMHEQPVFQNMGLFGDERYPVCERISRHGFYLPSGHAITDAQIKRVCAAMHEILA